MVQPWPPGGPLAPIDASFNFGGTPPAPPPTPWYLDFGGVWRRHTALVAIATLLCLACGFLVGSLFRTQYYAIEGRLRYIEPATIQMGPTAYKSLSLATYANLIKADENLEKLADEFKDRLPPTLATKFLQSNIRVETPLGNELLEVIVDVIDPEFGIQLVNRVMQLHVDYTNELRRSTILNQAVGAFTSSIEVNETQIRKWKQMIAEYSAKAKPGSSLEAFDFVEIDQTTMSNRKALLESLRTEEARLKEYQLTLVSDKAKLREKEQAFRTQVGTLSDLEEAQRQVANTQGRIEIIEETVRKKKEEYRKLPIDAAQMKILELDVQNKEAEVSLQALKQMLKASPAEQAANDEWRKLRLRLLGADSPEFAIIKPATRPPFPTASNRKLLTLAGFGIPMACIFLSLAYWDHRNGRTDGGSHGVRIEPPTPPDAPPMPHDESALLSSRIQQWIVDSPPPPR